MPRTAADRLSREERRRIAAILKDPAAFARRFLRHDVWDTSARILRSVRDHPRTAVKACHASSKTFTAAEAVLWWFTIHPDGIVVTTAPTWTQVSKLLWGEIHKAAGDSRINYPPMTTTELKFSSGNFAIGISTNQGVRFQGWHGNVLIVLDEAPGVMPEIWDAIEGVRAGGDVRVLVLGNPIPGGGPFYDAFTKSRGGWKTFTIDGLDTPNTWGCGATPEERLANIVAAGERGDTDYLNDNPRPYLITRRFIYEKWIEWGADNPLWQMKIRGQFPTAGPGSVFPLAWLEHPLVAQRFAPGPTGLFDVGIDVAGPGEDETALCMRQGPCVVRQRQWAGIDARGHVLLELAPYKARIRSVNVDVSGIGFYFAAHLEDHGYPVQRINVGEATSDPEKFDSLKSELYWAARERLAVQQIRGLVDEETVSQMSTLLWAPNNRGQIHIESKKEAKARGLPSPDRAEAVILAFAPPAAPVQRARIAPSISSVTLGG